MVVRQCVAGLIVALSIGSPVFAQTPDVDFFESKDSPGSRSALL